MRLVKAVGIDNGSIILQHLLRFVIVSVIACIVSSAVLMPISDVMMNWVGNMVGGQGAGQWAWTFYLQTIDVAYGRRGVCGYS